MGVTETVGEVTVVVAHGTKFLKRACEFGYQHKKKSWPSQHADGGKLVCLEDRF